MAAGDAYIKLPASVANGAFMDLQPSEAEVIVHNIYVPENTAIEIYYYDGSDTIKFQSGDSSVYDTALHCTEDVYIRVKNVSGSSAIMAADGITTKVVVAAFAPTDVSGLLAWWDYSDLSTLFQASNLGTPVTTDGQTILSMTDKSGSANHLSRSATGPIYEENILNGLSGGRHTAATGHRLECATLDAADFKPSTVFYVVNPTSFSNYRAIIGGNQNIGGYALRIDQTTGHQNLDKEATAAILNATNSWGAATPKIGATTYGSAGAAAHYMAGVANGSGTNNQTLSNNQINVGSLFNGDFPFDGDFHEILIYNTVLSTDDLNSVGDYLADKWALTWTGI